MHKCDACGQYRALDGLDCTQCQKDAEVSRKHRIIKGQITGGYDGRNYITGEAGSGPDSDQF